MKGLYGLVAMQYRPAEAQAHFRSLPNGAPLILRRDPNNRFDPFAVQVWSGDFLIGFIKGSQVKPLAMAMDSAASAVSDELVAGGLKQGGPLISNLNAKLAIDGGKWPLVEVEE